MARTPPNPYLRAFGRHWMKPLTLVALLAPAAWLAAQVAFVFNGMPNDLGFEPEKAIHHFLGETALRILLLTLLISPLRDITGWAPITLIRRRVGLAAFFYAVAHLIAYLWLDKLWSMTEFADDIVNRLWVTVGLTALTLMTPLAITSNNTLIRAMGRKAWERLHWLIYPIAILAVIHHALTLKGFYAEAAIHSAILAFLLGWRVYRWIAGKLKARGEAVTAG